MAARIRDDLGPDAMEIAFDARALSITCLCNSQPLPTAMSAMSILAMAMVIYLFGGYIDFPERKLNDENKQTRTMQRHKISKLVSAAAALARSDARVQHRNIQIGKGPGMHLQVVSAARERLVMKKATTPAVCSPGI
jgi:hypothetical protein